VDARSDIYSLGAVAYYLLTGQPPFTNDNALALLQAHATQPVTPPSIINPAVPDDLERLVLRCLAKRREDRFQDASRLGVALEMCQSSGNWTMSRANSWWKAADRSVPSSQQRVPQ
jgi:eukaryotic-like serine/threonine-protein kinase